MGTRPGFLTHGRGVRPLMRPAASVANVVDFLGDMTAGPPASLVDVVLVCTLHKKTAPRREEPVEGSGVPCALPLSLPPIDLLPLFASIRGHADLPVRRWGE